MKVFPSYRPIELVELDRLGPLPITKDRNRFAIVITDRFAKMIRSIPMQTTPATKLVEKLFGEWIIPHGSPDYFFADNGP